VTTLGTTRRPLPIRNALAFMALAVVTLVACGPSERYVEPPIGESGVAMWPDYGDFLVDGNKAISWVTAYRLEGDHESADILMRIAGTAQARWVGSWMDDDRVATVTRSVFRAAQSQDRIALIAFAGEPELSCELDDLAAVRDAYTSKVAASVRDLQDFDIEVWVILEPSAVDGLELCDGRADHVEVMNAALEVLDDAGVGIYLDASNVRGWAADDAAARLAQLDLSLADGILLGVGGYDLVEVERERGEVILDILADHGHHHLSYIIDTSRTGNGTAGDETCNAPGQALGKAPRLVGDGRLEAYVWIKRPGESDGPCNTGVGEGEFAPDLAMELARNANPDNA
jgi:endoglucanase